MPMLLKLVLEKQTSVEEIEIAQSRKVRKEKGPLPSIETHFSHKKIK